MDKGRERGSEFTAELGRDWKFHAPTGGMDQRSMLTRSVVAIYWTYIYSGREQLTSYNIAAFVHHAH